MFIQVKLLHGSSHSLWYQTDDTISYRGAIVQVPLRATIVPALVIAEYDHAPKTSFDIRYIQKLEPFPADNAYELFTQKLAHYYQIDPLHFFTRIRHFLIQKPQTEAETPTKKTCFHSSTTLTQEQQTVCDQLEQSIINPHFNPCVLQGVTGSGKTEVYKHLILTALQQGKNALLLLPEVTLALGFEHRLKQELPGVTIIGFHSATTMKEKRVLWQRLIEEKPTLIIGVHLPILLPIPALGIIIVDEEHEVGYQEKKHPKINSKEAALIRAQVAGIPIVLGSATPSFQTLYQVEQNKWSRFRLTKRFSGELPHIKTVFLNDKKQRKQFWISHPLEQAIKERLAKKEQSIIFINRRGYSFFVQCKQCSFIFTCTHCSVSLTLHEQQILMCHYCGDSQTLPQACLECKAPENTFLKKGIGTQQVVTMLQSLFPQARIARADLDTTTRKKQWQETMNQFSQGGIDILVGTQTITKGYDFPRVTLVGVLWADLQLHFPMYNAAENALQQLIQVAGRAGRRELSNSLVIIQALDNHPVFNFVSEMDYERFYEKEKATRKLVGYPPYKRLAELELKSKDERIIEKEAQAIVSHLQEQLVHYPNIRVLGPAKPPVHKVKNVFTRKIYLKAEALRDINALYKLVIMRKYKSKIFFTPNPLV